MLSQNLWGACRKGGAAAGSVLVLAGLGLGTLSFYSPQAPEDGLTTQRIATGLKEANFPFYACFDAANPPSQEVMGQIESKMRMAGADQNLKYNASTAWNTFGEPFALTWSLVQDGASIPNLNSTTTNTLFATLDSQFSSQGGRATWISLIAQSFARFEETSGLTYTRITFGGNDWDDGANMSQFGSGAGNANRGDIRIASGLLDGGGGVLAFNFFPTYGDMVIDSGDSWSASAGNFRKFRNVIMHEHGHGLGASHVCSNNANFLFEPFLSTAFDGIQHDDIGFAQFAYGDIYEPNDNGSIAAGIGSISGGSSLNISNLPAPAVANSALTSLHNSGDQDWYRLTATDQLFLDVTLTPVGFIYDDSDQLGNGSCDFGAFTTNSRTHANLILEVWDSTNTTLLASSNATGSGGTEAVQNVLIGAGQDVLIRVDISGSASRTQMYTLVFDTVAAACITDPDCDDGNPCNGTETCVLGQCITTFTADCNGNGIEDACDITSGFSLDCNNNGIPDECDIAIQNRTFDSGQISPFGFGSTTQLVVNPAPTATGDVAIQITAVGDLDLSDETANVLVNGNLINVFGFAGQNCPTTPDQLNIVLTAAQWNMWRDSSAGTITIDLVPTAAVNAADCGGSSWARIQYAHNGFNSLDANGNGIPDECETITCGIADTTTTNTNPGDPNFGVPDGVVNGADLSYFVEQWLAGNIAIADVNTTNSNPGDPGYGVPDGAVNGADLSFFVEKWLGGCVP